MTFGVGVDLGQSQDYTAICAVESKPFGAGRMEGTRRLWDPQYAVRTIVRLPLGTPYPEVVKEVRTVVDKCKTPPMIAVDATGVGRAVVDMLELAGVPATRITIVAGNAPTCVPKGWHVPKKDLVGTLQSLLGTRRLKIDPRLDHAKDMEEEFRRFSMKVSASGKTSFDAWRASDHDDLVLSLAVILWLMEKYGGMIEEQIAKSVPGSKEWAEEEVARMKESAARMVKERKRNTWWR